MPTPAQLKVDAEQLAKDAEVVLALAENLPLPPAVKDFLAKADAFVKDVEVFLAS